MAGQPNVRLEKPGSEQPSLGIDQRGTPRLTLLIRTAKLVADGREFLCIVRNVSASGVKVRIFHPLPRHETLLLETDNGDRHPVELIWDTHDHAGFRFTEEVDFQRFIDETPGLLPKRKVRVKVALEARIHAGSEISKATICDISQQGGCIKCEKWLLLDELVRIETKVLPPIYAKVRWRRDSQYGVIFEQTFKLEELAQLLAPLLLEDALE